MAEPFPVSHLNDEDLLENINFEECFSTKEGSPKTRDNSN